MKFNCGLSRHEKFEWHRWFAWRPVRVATGDCRWLEFIERKKVCEHCGFDMYIFWRYRAL